MGKIYVPPIKIQGIKTKIVGVIKENIVLDENGFWLEPFMGSGVVGFNVNPKNAVFSDTNPYIIQFYNDVKSGKITAKIVREYLEKEGEQLKENDDKHYYLVRDRFNKNHESLDFLFLNRSCFNGMIRFNKDYNFNVPYGHKPERFSKAYVTKIVNQVKHIEGLMKDNNWSFICCSFEETIRKATKNDFIYCDPPYIGRHVDYYDSWDEDKEKKLHEMLNQSEAKYMLSTWDHNSYRKNEYLDTLWKGCYKINKEHFYHVGAKEENRNAIIEALLLNYEPKNRCL